MKTIKRLSATLISFLLLTNLAYAQTQLSTDIQVSESAVITAPTATANADGGGANCTSGAHNFAVSFVTSVGGQSYETGIGNGSAAATCDGTHTKVDLTVVPLGSFNVTARNVYATKAGTTTPFYLVSNNSVADNTTTTYQFNTSDANLTTLLTSHATPPAASVWRFLSNGNVIPLNDNTQLLGDATHRVTKINALTLPTGTDTLVGRATTDTLSNKSIATAGLAFLNATSGSVTLNTVTGALGSVTLSLPAATDTLVGKATTDSLSNKSIPTAGIGFTNATSGTITVAATSGALGTVTLSLPAATDTLVGKATSDSFTNKTFATAGVGFTNATSGTITIAAPTGALGTPTFTLPAFASGGGIPVAIDCGSTGSGNQTCSPTTTTGLTKIIAGHSTLSSNAAVITLPASSAYTSSTTYDCVGNDITTRANPVQVVPTNGTTFTITNTTGASDVIQWVCVGN